jgi:hypothetical protein
MMDPPLAEATWERRRFEQPHQRNLLAIPDDCREFERDVLRTSSYKFDGLS